MTVRDATDRAFLSLFFSLSDSLGVGLTTLPRARRAYYDIYQPTLYSIVIELESHVLGFYNRYNVQSA